MPVTRLVFFFLLFICLSPCVQSQTQFTRLTEEDGLGNNSVQCILQDREGIVWIGTNGGLSRYDGAAFLPYNVLNKPLLSSNDITSLLQDETGIIWIGTGNGLNALDPVTGVLRAFPHSGLPSGPVRSLQKRKDGSIWILSDSWLFSFRSQGGFRRVRLDPSLLGTTKVFTDITPADERHVWISYLDQPAARAVLYTLPDGMDSIGATGQYWPGCSRICPDTVRQDWGLSYFGVSRYDSRAGRPEPWLTNAYAQKIPDLHLYTCYDRDAEGNVWEGGRMRNLVKYDLQHRQTVDYSWLLRTCNATMVLCIYRDNSNTIWIGTDNGIIKLSGHSFFFTPITCIAQGQELRGLHCRKILADHNGVLYAGTESHGLLKLTNPTGGQYVTQQLSVYGAFPVSSLPCQDNKITVPLNGKFDIGYIYDIWDDGGDVLWLAGYGFGRFDTRTSAMEIFLSDGDEQMRRESISQFSICKDDSLFWLGGQRNVFIFDTGRRRMRPFQDAKGDMPFHNIACWCVARKGRWIWAGTEKGLFRIDRLTRTVTREDAAPLKDRCINAIYIDKDSSFWISTAGGGVVHYNTETRDARPYTTREGLSNDMVCGIVPDGQNNLWISTYSGLSCLNPKTGQFSVFYTKDGLSMNEFNRKAFTRLPDGRLIFGGLNGYLQFDPAEILKFNKPANLLLTRFGRSTGNGIISDSIFGASALRHITVGPESPFFSLTYTLTDMYDPARNLYFYKMEGLDDAWHALGNQHTLSFMSLPAGNYTLRIKGQPAQGQASENELAVAITVQQVFYKRPWFLVLCLVMAAVIIWSVMQYRLRQWKKLHDLRTRIASDLHDEVGSNLVRITLLADANKNGYPSGTPGERLDTISDISRGAAATIRDIVWSIDARNDTMTGMLEHMHEHLYQMLSPAGIEYLFNHSGVHSNERLKMEFRQNIYRIFREAVNNIVKHSGASLVKVEIVQEDRQFTMMIRDNGLGMTGRRSSGGQGLSNMQMRADRIGGKLDIDSGAEGVKITLTVSIQ